MKRYIMEFGMGIDLHGQDVTNAAIKAVKNAVQFSCLCGLVEVLEIDRDYSNIYAIITIATTKPDEIDHDKIAKALTSEAVKVEVIKGGMRMKGLKYEPFGDTDESIEVVNACVEVFV